MQLETQNLKMAIDKWKREFDYLMGIGDFYGARKALNKLYEITYKMEEL